MTNNKDKAATKKPLINKKDVWNSNDKKIDDDFPGFPSNPSKENMINPKTETDKLVSGTDKKLNAKQANQFLNRNIQRAKQKRKKLPMMMQMCMLAQAALLKERRMCGINNNFYNSILFTSFLS